MITFRRLGHFGRFGNQLFQYAGTRLYAELNGFSWAFPPWIGDRLFSLPATNYNLQARLLPTLQLQDLRATSWSERLLRPIGFLRRGFIENIWSHPHDNRNLFSYMQDPVSLKQLQEHKEKVSSWFTFRPEIEHAFRAATDSHRPWVAVHVRRGDIVKRNLAVPLERYFEVLPKVVGDKKLFVASDSPDMTKEFQDFPVIFVNNPLPHLPAYIFDFWMLK